MPGSTTLTHPAAGPAEGLVSGESGGDDRPPVAIQEAHLATGDLAMIMQTFTAVTERLQAAHTTLEGETRRLKEELRETNEQLRRSRQLAALGQMAAGIAHEIRNPLGSIRLFASLLEHDLAAQPQSCELAVKIGRAVRDLDAIVGDVLTFSRDAQLRAAPAHPSELFSHAIDSCQALIQETSIVVVRDDLARETGRRIYVDRALMLQTLINIIRNAAQAVEVGGRGRITLDWRLAWLDDNEVAAGRNENGDSFAPITSPEPDGATLIVSDNGPGVSDDVLEHMFNPFFTTRSTGTGLGLAIVHRIVDAHRGRINIRNNEDCGARVELTFPLAPIDGSEEKQS